ncbi:erythromycin esterase [Arthrobacter woluwensis]|uniref:erythromycin esterase family protein n=1 Tax=Arthrobacter woluwensis TaxID=156980 RepID=UPI00277F673F|nr:erythromycin esterase family protein [Arthrobacter woluwensis]MDQ0709789.1 erythromycin esterase [Arthrobacter woluwensis]
MAHDSESELTAWLTQSARRLATVSPDTEDDADLEPLLEIIGDARVVALGESTHRIHEFYLIRHRIFRFLARHAGFTALVMESGFPEGLRVDRWIQHGGGRVREVLREGISYHFGKCQEMLDQLAWMRQHALDGRPLRFYGMDLADSGASALPGLLTALDLLDDVDPEYAAHSRKTLLPFFEYLPADRAGLAQAAPSIQAYLVLPESDRFALTAQLHGFVERMRARRIDYSATADPGRVEAAVRAAETALGTDAFLAAMTAGPTRTWPGANIRDVVMADTVEWILEREPRILVAAANGHIKKTPYTAPPVVTEPLTMLGEHLADRLGDDYVAIGSTYGGGTAWLHRPGPDDGPGHSTPFVADLGAPFDGSLDQALARPGIGDYFVDLRDTSAAALSALRRTTGTHNGPGLEPSDAAASFDAVVHLDRIGPWHTWIDEHGIG